MPVIRLLILILLLMNFAPEVRADVDLRLEAVTTTEGQEQTRIVLDFLSLPAYRLETSGQRVDLILPGTTISSSLREKSENGRVIKVLFAKKREELIVSFLLRQPPARILTATEGARRLVLDLFWQESSTRTAIAFQIPGVPTRQKGQPVATMKPSSRYTANWEQFFREYRTPLLLAAPLRYSRLPLPAGAAAQRLGQVYLQSIALATAGNPHQAKILLQDAQSAAEKSPSLRPFYRLLRAEIALATGAFNEGLRLLEKDDNLWPLAFTSIRQARTAAALSKIGKGKPTRQVFLSLVPLPLVLTGDAFLLESAGGVFFASGDYDSAAACYRGLEETLVEPAEKALANFAWAQTIYLGNGRSLGIERLQQLKETFSPQEAGNRAWLQLLDHGVLTRREAEYPTAIAGYGVLAEQSPVQALREEAAFKQAVVLAWSGQSERSVRQLQDFLRDFRAGNLRGEAEALLAELLPAVIQNLVARGEDLQAVVLAEQNRHLLLSDGMGWAFLDDLASAFTRMGLPERAGRVYLFMLDSSRQDADKEPLYLPLVQSFWDRGEFLQAEYYAGQYLQRYPRGRDRAALFLWRLQSLVKGDQRVEAARLLRLPAVPWDLAVELEAARILSATGDFRQLAALAGRAAGRWTPAPETELLQAEALREVGREAQALPLYQRLREEEAFADQAAFRTAQILLKQGEKKAALKILSRLAETGRSPLWRRLAEETQRAAAN